MAAPSPLFTSPISAQLGRSNSTSVAESNTAVQLDGAKDKIKKMFGKTELWASAYDTARVAMVPSPNSQQVPFFPECSKWIVDNQLTDGSWGIHNGHPSLVKDSLMSTLACVLALKQWGIGERQVNKGLQFIEMNSALLTDQKKKSPVGFDIIFPHMLEHAKESGLNVPLDPKLVDSMLLRRDMDLKSVCGSNPGGRNAYLAYISEGIGELKDWDMVMKYQRKNGSILNSPSATATAFSHINDPSCLHYLQNTLKKLGNAVPTVYPFDIYARLRMIDTLESLGIGRYFQNEINSVLDETYIDWLQGNEEIFLDLKVCAMAFRILRANGYYVSSEKLSQFTEDYFLNSLEGYLEDIRPPLELYKASQILFRDELSLDKQLSWTGRFLKQKLSSDFTLTNGIDKQISEEVRDALKFSSYADLERLNNYRTISRFPEDETKMLKTSYRCSNITNRDFLELAVADFNTCQSVHQEELKQLGSWMVETRLDELKFVRQKLGYCYFSGAAALFPPEMSEARISWAKNSVLTYVIDDFFDVEASEEELLNFVDLVERWDVDGNSHFCSENVEILFSALRSTICELAEKAFVYQGRDITNYAVKIWLDSVKSMLTEALWSKSKATPTLDEYITNGYTSFALGPIVLLSMFLVGPKLSEEDMASLEIHDLFKAMSTCGRLLNDCRGLKRETEQGKLNVISLLMMSGNGVTTEEEAIDKIKGLIECNWREVMRLVLRQYDSTIPRRCKDLFWQMTKILNMFYLNNDGFTSNEMVHTANALLNQPISFLED